MHTLFKMIRSFFFLCLHHFLSGDPIRNLLHFFTFWIFRIFPLIIFIFWIFSVEIWKIFLFIFCIIISHICERIRMYFGFQSTFSKVYESNQIEYNVHWSFCVCDEFKFISLYWLTHKHISKFKKSEELRTQRVSIEIWKRAPSLYSLSTASNVVVSIFTGWAIFFVALDSLLFYSSE